MPVGCGAAVEKTLPPSQGAVVFAFFSSASSRADFRWSHAVHPATLKPPIVAASATASIGRDRSAAAGCPGLEGIEAARFSRA